ncbi:alpha/beta fold hydrolase [Bacteroidota bacterium]
MQKKVNDLTVWTEGNRKKQTVIFVHGFPYDHTMWHNQIEALRDDYFCVSYDLRGLGKSKPGDGQYTMEMHVDDLFAVMKGLRLRKPVVCALSMGGYIALRAVERDQSKFKGLILCDTKSEADTNAGRLARAAAIRQINEKGVEKFVVPFVKNCFSDITLKEKKRKEVYTATLEKALKSKATGLKGALLAMAGRTDTTDFLSEIIIPTLLIVGQLDNLTPPNVMRAMHEKIPNSDFGIAPRAGHMAPLENPGFVNDMIKGFVGQI